MTSSEDYLHLDRDKLMNELRDLSAKYNQSYAIQLQTETKTKELNAGLFIKHKTGQEKISVKEIEAKIILDPHMTQQRLKDNEARISLRIIDSQKDLKRNRRFIFKSSRQFK